MTMICLPRSSISSASALGTVDGVKGGGRLAVLMAAATRELCSEMHALHENDRVPARPIQHQSVTHPTSGRRALHASAGGGGGGRHGGDRSY